MNIRFQAYYPASSYAPPYPFSTGQINPETPQEGFSQSNTNAGQHAPAPGLSSPRAGCAFHCLGLLSGARPPHLSLSLSLSQGPLREPRVPCIWAHHKSSFKILRCSLFLREPSCGPFSPGGLLAVFAFFHNCIQSVQDSLQVPLCFDVRDFLLKRGESYDTRQAYSGNMLNC